MKRGLSFLIFYVFLLSTISAQSWQFANSFGGLHGDISDSNNKPAMLAIDSHENSYVYGNYGELTNFNGTQLLNYNDGASGNFLVKYDCEGNVDWFKVIANTENRYESASWMEIKDDYIYLQGHIYMDPESQIFFLDTLVNGTELLNNFPDNNTYPWIPYRHYTYIVKLDLNGNIINYHLLSNYRDYLPVDNIYGIFSANTQLQIPFHIDNAGSFYLTAHLSNYLHSVIICDNLPITDSLLPSETTFPQTYLLKFDNEFNFQWVKPMGVSVSSNLINSTYINFLDIENDSQNNIYLAGSMNTISINNPEYPIFVEFNNDIFLETCVKDYKVGIILKFNPNGELLWARQSKNFGEHSYSEFESIEISTEDDIFITGTGVQVGYLVEDVGTIFGENDTLTTPTSMASNYTGFIAKYDTEGNYHWAKSINSFEAFVSNISLYNNKIYASVKYQTSLTHGDSTYMYINPNPPYGVDGLTLCSWDFEGNPVESVNIPSSCKSSNHDLVPYQTKVSSLGNIFIAGTMDSTLFFGDYSTSGDESLKMFIAKYGNLCPVYSEVTESFCYGELYNNIPITESGSYEFVLNSSIPEVDSIIYLNAIVFPVPTSGISDTTFCVNTNYTLQANNNNLCYEWSTGSLESNEILSFNNVGEEEVYVTVTDNNCIGIDTIVINVMICDQIESNNINKIITYPVPAKSQITIQIPDNEHINEYIIYDLYGKIISSKRQTYIDKNITININHLASGKYIIHLNSNDNTYIGSFIKQ